jgi:hypothetical protein
MKHEAEMRDKKSLSLYGELKHSGGRETYTSCCNVKERSGVAWFRLGIWKLRAASGFGEGQMPPMHRGGERNAQKCRGGVRSS